MKEELDRAESFKILQHAADDLRGIPDIENKKDLAVKKWEEATEGLATQLLLARQWLPDVEISKDHI